MASQKELILTENRYSWRSKGFRGKFVVISNENFDVEHLKSRNGTANDVKRLEEIFSGFGFNFDNNVHTDRTALQMWKIMRDVKNAGLEQYDCLAIAILTHGAHDGRIYGTDHLISLDKLFEHLKDGTKDGMQLNGKPILIFIQACRGEDVDVGKQVQTDGRKENNGSNTTTIPVEADFLYHFSSSPGYYSFRNGYGSIFIQSLCNVMAHYLKRKEEVDLMKALTQVNRDVAERFSAVSSDIAYNGTKQMPNILSTLRKDVYLYPK